MTDDVLEVNCRPRRKRVLWLFAAVGAAGLALAVVRTAIRGHVMDLWVFGGLTVALINIVFLYAAITRVSADAYGLHSRTLLRRRNTPWSDIAELRAYVQYGYNQEFHRVSVMLRNGRRRRLPLPLSGSADDRADFDAKLDALRALHHRYGGPESSRAPVISTRSAGRGSAVSLSLCVLFLAGAGLAAWFVPAAGATKQAWTTAVPCAPGTPAADRGECLTTGTAVIARAEVGAGNQESWLYFADGRPQERLRVSREGARGFEPGDSVALTVWRHEVQVVTGEHHVWREHFTGAGDVAVVAAGCALAACYPGAKVLLRRRGRRLRDDEVLPSALPFGGALVVTAVWLLPFCYLHPMDPLASPATVTWAASGSVVTLVLLVLAWRATRVRTPVDGAAEPAWQKGERFLAARFLDHTDYNPNGFGTHIVLGDGPPAVTPHPGPGRFAARPIPVERLSVRKVRRIRGSDGDAVRRSWHIAELDDAGVPVRLAAAPADLAVIIRELGHDHRSANAGRPRP